MQSEDGMRRKWRLRDGHSRLADLGAEPQTFALNPLRAPERTSPEHLPKQIPDLGSDHGPPWSAALPSPIQAESLAMPRDYGSGLTTMSDLSQARQILGGSTQSPKSMGPSRGCLTDRRRTPIGFRRARYSRMSAWRGFMTAATMPGSSAIMSTRLMDRPPPRGFFGHLTGVA